MPDHDTYYDFSNICIRSEPEKSELCMLFAAYRRFMLTEANTVIDRKKQRKGQGIVAERNEADALFATRRKKQQEEQAEQEKREELARKKAEMEAEIQRLEEVARQQQEQQAAWRPKLFGKRKNAAAQQGKRKSPLRYLAIVGLVFVAVWVVVQLVDIIWFVCSLGKGDVSPDESVQTSVTQEEYVQTNETVNDIVQNNETYVQLSGKEVYGIHFDSTASAMVFGDNIYYPDSFEEVFCEEGALFTYGSVENGDFSYVIISGTDMGSVEEMIGSTDPVDFVRLFSSFYFETESETVYEMTSDSKRTAYYSDCYPLDFSQISLDMPQEVWTWSSVMTLISVDGEGYLTALYGTMREDYMLALDETVIRFLDHTS